MNARKLILIAFSVISVLFIMAFGYVFHERNSIYPYDTTLDYLYDFNSSNAAIQELKIESGEVSFKKDFNNSQSAFLKVKVETTLLGKFFQPSIDVTVNKNTYTQYFELNANGSRFINISPLTHSGEIRVKIKGNNVHIKDQNIQLITFNNRNLKKRKILILSPHPDDAEIAAYGLYSDHNESHIVTITAGEAGGHKYDEIYKEKEKHYLKKGEIRTWNSITVPFLGDIHPERCLNLGFFDGSLKRMSKAKYEVIPAMYTGVTDINTFRKFNISSLKTLLNGKANWDSLVNNLNSLLVDIRPDIIVTPHPLLDSHPDHSYTSIALIEALKKVGLNKGELYFYSNHYILNEYFPYGQEGGSISLPPNFKKNIYFDGIYSHPLSIDKQKDKIFALEAMHDLRQDTEWRFVKGSFRTFLRNLYMVIFSAENNYYKRAIRSNELFYVVNINNLYDDQVLSSIVGHHHDW